MTSRDAANGESAGQKGCGGLPRRSETRRHMPHCNITQASRAVEGIVTNLPDVTQASRVLEEIVAQYVRLQDPVGQAFASLNPTAIAVVLRRFDGSIRPRFTQRLADVSKVTARPLTTLPLLS